MGDPGGIGPEIVVRAVADAGLRKRHPDARFVIHGSSTAMHAAAQAVGVEPNWWAVDRGSELVQSAMEHRVVLIDADADVAAGLPGGREAIRFEPRPGKLGGLLSFTWVNDAIDAAKRPEGDPLRADAIVTAPINKLAWDLAAKARGLPRYPGHTELLARRFEAERAVMMFEGPRLRVSLATVHLPLMDVRNVLTIGKVYDAIDLGVLGCQMLGVERPRVAVCGLNPHAGEGGLMGDEETRLIEPAIGVAVDQGMDVRGPFPADTIFGRAVDGEFDLVVAMYHDQGLIPVKLLDRDSSVNITVGLPTVRTSPDHGTAFDIAGTGRADAGSMIAAIDAAVRMATPAVLRAHGTTITD